MFSDTLAITINAVAKNLVRVNQDGYSSEYRLRETLGEYSLRLRNTTYADKSRGGVLMDRHTAELVHTVYPVAPSTVSTVRKFYSVLENQKTDDLVSPVKHAAGLVAFLTEANLTKLTNFES
jgi:hypothetical protein